MEDELQRLRADVQGLGEVIKGMERTIAAERRHSATVEADNMALLDALNTLMRFVTAGRYMGDAERDLIGITLASPHPGAAILAVVDAAREAVTTQSTKAYADLAAAVAEMEKS